MIKKIQINNFKCFKFVDVNITPLTILAGINSMGKSTVIESLLLLRESYLKRQNSISSGENRIPSFTLRLNNQYMRLGHGSDVLCDFSDNDIISMKVVDQDNVFEDKWKVNKSSNSSILQPMNSYAVTRDKEIFMKSKLFAQNNNSYIDFSYITADRIGPRSWFDVPDESVEVNHNIGSKGEYAAFYYNSMQNKDIPLLGVAAQDETPTIDFQVNKWMECISPNTKIHTTVQSDMDAAQLTYSYSGSAKNRRSINVGFGLTYTLPIILALLTVQQGGILLLENPEAHLHPHAQTMLGRLIARVVENGAQIILETHSDHIINGIRVAIKEQGMKPDKLLINFFSASDDKNDSTPRVTQIKADENGKLNDWPKDFLSEWEDNLFKLL